ncbi:aminotransferase class I/II-fold pyridoxal phosphate-dependent enzyme [Sulfurospirillum sp. T05]|uniref:Aminotransferase class I/II-fold pyridoxal phosphate-dependent enzyme n=1 Tax=Sulfurospirillum tamanense TaxID=2813362 RepID=A0ABS2WS34_9BACT|nr:aminotransferase class I/II-fold pyridoxal phosphate-dependent enzyme [Sulfurospirillum tamanensis]MBN2964431.1 aminotransferase class I/II-fold pyridoxal phosphate-dependent enzyme [Sulfurospirillum tamanensis]
MRCDTLTSFMVMDIVREASQYDDAIHFEIGQPDLAPSPKVLSALQEAIGKTAYTESLGLLALRQKIARYYAVTHGVDVPSERIVLTPGTSGAFVIAYALALSKGERLGLSDPSYPCYKNVAQVLDIEPYFMPISKEDSYQLTPLHVKGKGLHALQISSPANPTGNLYDPNTLSALIATCKEEKIAFISDELYHGLTYGTKAHTALEFDKDAYVINGFSKYYCLPGFRLGWVIVPQNKVREAEKLAQNLFICPATLSQYAALEAFDAAHLENVRRVFEERRDYLYGALSPLFSIDAAPEGAFYLWADVSKYTDDSTAFAKKMLEEIHVAVTPGADFGTNQTHLYVRFAYTRDIAHMKEGVARIKKWLGRHLPPKH